jgi:hypothetical protein
MITITTSSSSKVKPALSAVRVLPGKEWIELIVIAGAL